MAIGTSTGYQFGFGSPNRVLAACLIASLALHSTVLLLFPDLQQRAPAASAKVLIATLGPRITAPEPVQATAETAMRLPKQDRPKPEVKEAPEPPRPALTRPVPADSSVPQLPEKPAPDAAPAAQKAPTQAASAAPSSPQAAVPATRAPELQAPASSSASPSATARAGDAADPGTLDQYRLALIGAAKRYSRLTFDSRTLNEPSGTQKRATVRMVIGPNGMISNIAVQSSSGHEVLDKHALESIRKAKPLVPIPAALRNREFAIEVQFIFEIT